MIKSRKGISLVSLIITIVVMMIIATMTINTSLDRFEINDFNKMINDLELLKEKVSNYYLRYNAIPVVRDDNNNIVEYTYTILDFEKSVGDNENYYILDLEAMEGISLNYGKEGFDNPNTSNDVYIINEQSHSIYYVKGIKWNDKYYHSILENKDVNDNIPPSKPQINIVSGEKNEEGIYITEVKLELVSGKDNWSGVKETICSITSDGIEISNEKIENSDQNKLYTISESGKYKIFLKTYDNNGNVSENTCDLEVVTKVTVATLKGKEILSETENVQVDDIEDRTLIVPAGFAIASDSANTIREGVVITDSKENGNEFVWIPVDDINAMVMCKSKAADDQCNIQLNSDETELICKIHADSTDICGKLYATSFGNNFNSEMKTQKFTKTELFREPDQLRATSSGGDASSTGLELLSSIVGLEGDITITEEKNKVLTQWEKMLNDEYKEMALEVAKKGGFYVGRYETSIDNNSNKVQSKKLADVATSNAEKTKTWYGLYAKQKEFRTLTMKSSMIWGSQYDAMMLWMLENNIDIKSTTPIAGASKNTSNTQTGYNDKDQLNKVYDLLGLKREWTLEASSTSARIYRGGYSGGNIVPSYRGSFAPHNLDNMYGSRMVLY